MMNTFKSSQFEAMFIIWVHGQINVWLFVLDCKMSGTFLCRVHGLKDVHCSKQQKLLTKKRFSVHGPCVIYHSRWWLDNLWNCSALQSLNSSGFVTVDV